MPATSKKQFRFLAMLAHGKKPKKAGSVPSPEQAKEFIQANKGAMAFANLPESAKAKKRRFKIFSKGK